MTEVREVDEGRRTKDVTIRGLDADVYNRVAEIARRSGKTVGEIVNEALRFFVDLTEGLTLGMESLMRDVESALKGAGKAVEGAAKSVLPGAAVISGIDRVRITKEDFEQFGKRVIFQDIERLELDVDKETFEKYVVLIRSCEEVVVPKGLSKLLVLSRCRDVDRVVFKDGEEEEELSLG